MSLKLQTIFRDNQLPKFNSLTTIQKQHKGDESLRKASKKNKSIQSRINRLLEIPQEISTNLPKITVIGFKQMLIENYKGILEYQDFYIRISTHIGILNINGYDLYLEEMTTDDLLVTGKIESLDFETITDEEQEGKVCILKYYQLTFQGM